MAEEKGKTTSESFTDIRLTGGRFERAGYPLDAINELGKYQRLITEVAKSLWRNANPGSRLPRNFQQLVRLRLSAVHQGSVIPVTVPEEEQGLESIPSILKMAQQEVDRLFDEIVKDAVMPASQSPAVRSAIASLGSSFTRSEAITFRAHSEHPIRYDRAIRRRLLNSLPEEIVLAEGVLLGKVTELNTKQQSFILDSFGSLVPGAFSQKDVWSDLRDVLDAPDNLMLVRLTCSYFVEGLSSIKRIDDVTDVEVFLSADDAWTQRLSELASLADGWLDGDGESIDLNAIEFARDLLASITEKALPEPLVFPTPTGGIQLEWAAQTTHAEISIDASLTSISAYRLDAASGTEVERQIVGIEDALAFVTEVVSG